MTKTKKTAETTRVINKENQRRLVALADLLTGAGWRRSLYPRRFEPLAHRAMADAAWHRYRPLAAAGLVKIEDDEGESVLLGHRECGLIHDL